MSYSDLLRDPRWQRKRLEVMEAACFQCVECGDAKTTLNVHHTHYVKGRMPWEYDAQELRCLCEPCHERITELLTLGARLLGVLTFAELEKAVAAILDATPAAPPPVRAKSPRFAARRPVPPEHAPLFARMEEIDAALPLADADGKDALTREKMELVSQLRDAGGLREWKQFR